MHQEVVESAHDEVVIARARGMALIFIGQTVEESSPKPTTVAAVRTIFASGRGNGITMSYSTWERELADRMNEHYASRALDTRLDAAPSDDSSSIVVLEVPLGDVKNGMFKAKFMTAVRACCLANLRDFWDIA